MATISTSGPAAHAPSGATGPSRSRRTAVAVAVLAMLAGSAVAAVVASTLMPVSYSWVRNAISESAAQGVDDAWVARLAFLLLGFAVLALASIAGTRWGPVATVLHRVYGLSMIAAAAFAHRPWLDVPFDPFEDFLHSVAAFAAGFSFTVGVLLVALRRGRGAIGAQVFDALAVIVALGASMLVFNVADLAGLVQRVMFGAAYLWYGVEAVRAARAVPVRGARMPIRQTDLVTEPAQGA